MSDFFEVPEGTDKIGVRIAISQIIGEAKKASKPQKCIMCGATKTSFCNSHSVPQMSLKEIADNGKVLHASAVMGFDYEILDPSKGVNNSGTFNFICRNCDGTFFQDYENEDNLLKQPNDKILAEIAVKNVLLQLSKRNVEKELLSITQRKFKSSLMNSDYLMNIKNLDIAEYEEELFFHKDIADNNRVGGYQILYWNILPYKVPLAMQSAICLERDLEGLEINNIYSMSPERRMQYLHLCVFPLSEKSVVLAFYHKRDKGYRRLRHQFNAMSDEKQLCYLNYLIFGYTENYFICNSIKSEIENNANIQKLSTEINSIPQLGFLDAKNQFGLGYIPVTMYEIPNFLSPEWAL